MEERDREGEIGDREGEIGKRIEEFRDWETAN